MTYYFRQHLKSQHSKSANSAKAHKVGDATNAVEANREASDVEEILPNVNTQQNESAESSKNIGDGCDGSDQGLDDQPDDLLDDSLEDALDDSLDEGLDKQRDNGLSNEENIDIVPLPINSKTERTEENEENQGEEIYLGEIDLTKKHTYKRKIAHNTTAPRKKLRWNRK